MYSQRVKDVLFTAFKPGTAINHQVWRIRLHGQVPQNLKRGRDGQVWLNIGSGRNPLPGFVNIDINFSARPDMWLDVRQGLPFADGSVDRIYTCHVLEHFYADELTRVLRELHRVLRPGGGMRMIVPSLETAARAYLNRDTSLLAQFPRPYRSLGGQAVNLIFCDGQHRIGFDSTFAEELLGEAGFSDIQTRRRADSALFPVDALDPIEPALPWFETSLIVEASKQAAHVH